MNHIEFLSKIEQELSSRGLLTPLDIALVGATGVGKSSTLNALFGEDVAKVGHSSMPETQEVHSYQVAKMLRFHDTAGFGDGKEADLKHAKNLTELLCRRVQNHPDNGFIDLALVILDGSSRDLGTTYQLLTNIVLKYLPPERVIIAINQADMAMKGKGWQTDVPDATLREFLEQKRHSVAQRIKEATGLSPKLPACYSAYHGYNLGSLREHILAHLPYQRRKI